MSKWVTFYYDLFSGVHNLKIHNNKDEATQYFTKNYRNYFQLSSRIDVKLPMNYGYPHRKFCGMTKASFEKQFGKIDS